MRVFRAMVLGFCFVLVGNNHAQMAASPMKHLLVLAEEKGYRHEAVSHAAATIERLGGETGLWATTIRTDTEALTKQKLEYNAKNLNDFDAVLFYTGGDLEMNAEQRRRSSPSCTMTAKALSVFIARPSRSLPGPSTAK